MIKSKREELLCVCSGGLSLLSKMEKLYILKRDLFVVVVVVLVVHNEVQCVTGKK